MQKYSVASRTLGLWVGVAVGGRGHRGAWPPGGRGRRVGVAGFFWAAVQKSANFLFAVQKSANFLFAVQKSANVLFAVQNAVVKKWGKF